MASVSSTASLSSRKVGNDRWSRGGMNPNWTVRIISLHPWEARVWYGGAANHGVGVRTRVFPAWTWAQKMRQQTGAAYAVAPASPLHASPLDAPPAFG